MNMEEIKFTVIIPTRERSDVLEWSLRSVTTQNYKNIEIIISDNFSNDDSEKIAKKNGDSRIRYLNTGKRVSMSDNWEFALSHVTDGWVTIIGDDDALLPNSLEKVAKIIQITNIKAIRSETCSYGWPSLINKKFGALGVPMKNGWEKRDTTEWLAKVMKGSAPYTVLPMLYNGGFVDFSILKDIKGKTGRFYRSCVPDVYSACAISSSIKEYVYSFEPFAVNGASKHSNGTDCFSKRKQVKESPAMKFISEPNMPFHNDIPLNEDGSYPLSIQAIVYESYLQTEMLRKSSQFKNHQHQLELILATSGIHKMSVESWGMNFSKKHGLNFSNAIRKSSLKNRANRFSNMLTLFRFYIIDGDNSLLSNVYEASIAASTVRILQPSLSIRVIKIIYLANKKLLKFSPLSNWKKILKQKAMFIFSR
ncbi:MAG: glycosyltransferase family 2 protein [Candidatus Electronema sp. V4]|uniref:glycosyltransferase family 2 protein n=1 Tax=Candidatus Electronema sp. V4 TaxID=3454756 RepID=UPI00405566D4